MENSTSGPRAQLRKFGLALGGGLLVLGSLLLWRGRAAAPWILGVAAVVAVLALVAPRLLAPLERLFARLARLLTAVLTFTVLALSYFLVVTPMGLLMRLLRRDLLDMRAAPDRASFWVEVELDGPATRPDKPY